jgi:hypothetical protein
MTHLKPLVVLSLSLLTLVARADTPTSVPSQVIGQWRWGTINPVTYWDASTGQYRGHGGGTSCTYAFDDAGGYKMYLLFQTNNYGWQRTIWTYEEGVATWAGGKVTFKPTTGKYKVMDNRSKKDNYDRPMTDDELKKHTKTQPWSVEQRDGKPVFLTGSDEKSQATYRREEAEKKEPAKK